MKFLGVVNSQIIEELFAKENVKNLFQFTSKDNLPIRVGFCFTDNTCVLRFLAIQLENTSTFETFELFDMEYLGPYTIEDIEIIAKNISDEIVEYNKTILRYYSNNIGPTCI